MSLFAEENKIFEEWEKVLGKLPLVKDGIVYETKWVESSPKILFVLKEANHKEDPHSAVLSRKWLYNGAWSNTWGNIAMWTHAIRHYKENLKWSAEINLRSLENARRKYHLQTIAAMNLKKTPGGATTNKVELREFVKKYKDLLRNQVDLYWPQVDIIVCCGVDVFSLFRSLIKDIPLQKHTFQPVDTNKAKTIFYYQTDDGKLIIDFYHPQAHMSKEFMYNSIRDIVAFFYHSK